MNRRLRQIRRLFLASVLSASVALAGLASADAARPALASLARRLAPAADDGEAARVKVQVGASLELTFASAVSAAVVTDPAVASAAVSGARSVRLGGVKAGATILIVTTGEGRQVYAVEVPRAARRPARGAARRALREASAAEGFYGLTLARSAGDDRIAFAHTLDFTQRLGDGRTLRASADFSNYAFGEDTSGFSARHLSLALDTKSGSLELLDSSIPAVGPGRYGFGLRGARYTAAPGSARDGLDIFAGVSRADSNGGTLAGAYVPVVRSGPFLLRAGTIYGASRPGEPAGLRASADLRYAPDERTTFEAHVGGGEGGPSWGARLDLRRDKFGVNAEARRGGDLAGSGAYHLSAYWRPSQALRASARWQLFDAGRGRAATSTLGASVNYSPARGSRFSIALARSGGVLTSGDFATAAYQQGFGRWSNTVEARFWRTSPAAPGPPREALTHISEQLRRDWGRWAFTGSYNYLEREGGGAHGSTTTQEAGASLRASFERVRLEGGAFYRIFESGGGRREPGVRASAAVSYRLDQSTTLRFGVTRAVGTATGGDSTGFTFSLAHRFGGGRRGGFGLLRLLRRGGGGGDVAGFVFNDDNGNGQRDPGEGGAANMRVTLDGERAVTTGEDGGFRFKAQEGEHTVELASERLGVSLLSSTPNVLRLVVGGGRREVAFGVTDNATLSGRVTNDLGSGDPGGWPGIAGVRLRLLGAGPEAVAFTNSTGRYAFANVRPGAYTVELDAATLPADFRFPSSLGRPVTLPPAGNARLDFTLAAERAFTGTVYNDRDGDGAYDPRVDFALDGVLVEFAGRVTSSGKGGSYILRALPAGAGTLTARRGGVLIFSSPFTFGASPSLLTVNIPAP